MQVGRQRKREREGERDVAVVACAVVVVAAAVDGVRVCVCVCVWLRVCMYVRENRYLASQLDRYIDRDRERQRQANRARKREDALAAAAAAASCCCSCCFYRSVRFPQHLPRSRRFSATSVNSRAPQIQRQQQLIPIAPSVSSRRRLFFSGSSGSSWCNLTGRKVPQFLRAM